MLGGMDPQRNVVGTELEVCSVDPLTGFYRDGFSPQRRGPRLPHRVHGRDCGVPGPSAVRGQRPRDAAAAVRLPGLQPGDRWGVCADRWAQSFVAGIKAPVVLRATNEAALDHVPFDALQECAVDVPDDLAELLG